MRRLEVVKEFRFEAAHVLPNHPGKCSKLHGHSWLLRVGVVGKVNPDTGFVMDYIDLKKMVQPLIDLWDHSYLGAERILHGPCEDSIEPSFGGYPSSENLVEHVVVYMQSALAALPSGGDAMSLPQLSLVEIEETCTSRCTWRP
jgi:6-pyruvoyltetrahydropterin/6-carboxytetrahydropterin synthase